MLGLGNNITTGSTLTGISSPLDIAGCFIWFRHNTGVESDEDSGGSSHTHTSTAGNLADDDKIDEWKDQSGNDRHAVQTTTADKPVWVAASNSINYAAGKYMNISGDAIEEADSSNFTFVWRGTLSGTSTAMTMFGDSSTDFFRINSGGKVFRTKIGSSHASDFTESTALETDVLYTIILTRSGGDGTLEIRVDGGSSTVRTDHQWGSTTGTDTDAFTFSNLGSAANDQNSWRGIVKHAIYYTGALSTAQRNELQDWLKNID